MAKITVYTKDKIDELLDSSSAYPTSFVWTDGTSSGPTGALSLSDGTSVSFDAVPSASSSKSGIITTTSQTIAGKKTFSYFGTSDTAGTNIYKLVIGDPGTSTAALVQDTYTAGYIKHGTCEITLPSSSSYSGTLITTGNIGSYAITSSSTSFVKYGSRRAGGTMSPGNTNYSYIDLMTGSGTECLTVAVRQVKLAGSASGTVSVSWGITFSAIPAVFIQETNVSQSSYSEYYNTAIVKSVTTTGCVIISGKDECNYVYVMGVGPAI